MFFFPFWTFLTLSCVLFVSSGIPIGIKNEIPNKECTIGKAFTLEFNPNTVFNSTQLVHLQDYSLPSHFEKFNSNFEKISTITSFNGKFAKIGNKIFNYFQCTQDHQFGTKYCLEIIDVTDIENSISSFYPFPFTTSLLVIVIYSENKNEYLYGLSNDAVHTWNITDPNSISALADDNINFSGRITSGYYLKLLGSNLHFSHYTGQYQYEYSKAIVSQYDVANKALDPDWSGGTGYFNDKRITDFTYIKEEIAVISYIEYDDDEPTQTKVARGGFYIYDTSGDSTYKLIGSYTNNDYDIRAVTAMTSKDNLLYVLEYSHYDSGYKHYKISILDTTDHLNIQKLGEIETGVGTLYLYSKALNIIGDYLYFLDYYKLLIIDITDPNNPKLIEKHEEEHFNRIANQLLTVDNSILISGLNGLSRFQHTSETINGTCKAGKHEVMLKGCDEYQNCITTTFSVT